MKKKIVFLAVCILIVGVFVGCNKRDGVFNQSGLDKLHITSLMVTNDVTKKSVEVTDADGVNNFLDGLNNINIKNDSEEKEHSGCNVPGQNKYYIELKDEKGNIIGDVRISKTGGILVNNFENNYTAETVNEKVANELDGIIEKNINS
ncbi:hypothetical protein [uncultured Clostridium sp.]|uniref:hypothetical protein n=1 Tax=uncultured Clostridium sp. TaxID=59620 RepID=UPI002637E812|nr:hypothetical protein [uncultured Clostridium sp.]